MDEPDIFELIHRNATSELEAILDNPETKDSALRQLRDGLTPLHYAIRAEAHDCVLIIIGHAAGTEHINAVDDNGHTPLEFALQTNRILYALHILIAGGKATPEVLNKFILSPPLWADYRCIAFTSLLLYDRDCAILVAYLLTGNADGVLELGSARKELVNRLSNRAWFIFIDWALSERRDLAVVTLLPMVHRIPSAGIFFRAVHHEALQTQKAILEMDGGDHLEMVLVGVRTLLKKKKYWHAMALLDLADSIGNPDYTPPAGYLTEPPDPGPDIFDFAIPDNSALAEEDWKDQDLLSADTPILLSSIFLMASRSDRPSDLDYIIKCVKPFDNGFLADAFADCIPDMARMGAFRFIELAVDRCANIPQHTKTIALVYSLRVSRLKTAAILLSHGASPDCYTDEHHWLPLAPNAQGGGVQHCAIYHLLQPEHNGKWHTGAAKCALLLLAFGGRIEFWEAGAPNPAMSVLCFAGAAGHTGVISRAVECGANPAALLEVACQRPQLNSIAECVKSALSGLHQVLSIFTSNRVRSHDVISVVVRGLSNGDDGRGLIEVVNKLAASTDFDEDIQVLAKDCSKLLVTIFDRERKLFDDCLVTLIDHPPEKDVDETLRDLGIEHLPTNIINACASNEPPPLTALLAWMHIREIEGLAEEIGLESIISRHYRRPPQNEDSGDDSTNN